MKKTQNNYAYIDGANLHIGIKGLDWKLDYARFRVWLTEKYNVKRAYLFIGLVPRYHVIYEYLQECGFTLVFKQTISDGEGKIKGNCDADLVLRAVCDTYENQFEKSIIVSGDGDFASLVKFLSDRGKIRVVLAIDPKKCSILLKQTGVKITYLREFETMLSQKEKAPDADETA